MTENLKVDPIAELLPGTGPEYLERDLDGCFLAFEKDPTSTLQALEAVKLIAAAQWHQAGDNQHRFGVPNPTAKVAVPAWVVSVLAKAWLLYLADEGQKRVGETFGLEGTGRGQRRRVVAETIKTRQKKMALMVEYLRMHNKLTIEKAVALIAVQESAAEDTVKRAWKRFHKLANERMKRWGHKDAT